MFVLVVNAGSSSLKAAVVEHETGRRAATLRVERIGTDRTRARFDDEDDESRSEANHEAIAKALLPVLLERVGSERPVAVGHRVVHGGERFSQPTRIDDAVARAIVDLGKLAPLHNPANAAGIAAARSLLPDVPHVAVFDTAFHATLPPRARTYALPHALSERHGLRRFGFHGPSHGYVAARAAAHLGEELRSLRLVTCHLGNGASVAAIEYGRSIDTSMGMTPLEGLVMGTRSGDLDPGVILSLLRDEGLDAEGLDRILNRESGLAGLSGVGRDVRDIEARAAEGDDRCRLALHVFTHRLRKYIGGYAAVMGGVDAIVFTAGIGQNSAQIRHAAAQRLEFLGARLDEDRNRDAKVDAEHPVAEISAPHSRVRLLVVATDEAHAIAQHTAALAQGLDRVPDEATASGGIPVAISARHIHLTTESVHALFGPGRTLTARNPLSQPGQFACEETLTVVGPKRSIEKVRVLGPVRSKNQIEISRTDEFYLGVDAPVRNSGDVDNTPGVTLVGPHGRVALEQGLICARRHIHMTPQDAEAFGVQDRDVVEVAIDSAGRDLVFGDVLIRVSPKYRLEMHIDTDEANAAEISRDMEGMLVATEGRARLTRRTS